VSETLNIFGAEAILEAQPLSGVEELMLRPHPAEGWIGFGLLLLFFFGFRLIYCFFQQSKAELLHLRFALKHFEEQNQISVGLRLALMLLSAGIIAFGLQVLIRQSNFIEGAEAFVLIFAALAVVYLLKTLLRYLLGYLSDTGLYIKMIIYYSQLHIIIGSLLLFPLLILCFNREGLAFDILKIGIISICVSMFLYYLFRCWQIFKLANVLVFFRILYLCTLEFVPFLIIYKYISQG